MTEPAIPGSRYERRKAGATHSFRLSPKAAEIIDTHPSIKPGRNPNNKSASVSRAIVWFFTSPIMTRERNSDTGDFTGKYVLGSHGSPTPIELILKIENLENELENIRSAHEISQSETNRTSPGWGMRVISAIFGR